MAFPIASDYNEAFQNLSLTLLDANLRLGNVETTEIGLPKQISGANASVFQVVHSNEKWAIRCFLKDVADRTKRYGLISTYINKRNHKFLVPFTYMDEGVRVNGTKYPAIKMRWINGITLDQSIAYFRSNKSELERILQQWVDIMATLKKDSVAHGDLQHGNILYSNTGQIHLIDYDEMFVPGLENLKSNVIGHPNFQHSMRDNNYFTNNLDDFSAWVIFCSVKAIFNEHRLWDKLNGGDDCLLFRKKDYQNFKASDAYLALTKSGSDENKKIADLMCHVSEAEIDKVLTFSAKSFAEFGKPKTKPKPRKKQQKLVFNDDWIKDHLIPSDTKSKRQNTNESSTKQVDKQDSATDESWIFDHIDAKSFHKSEENSGLQSPQPTDQEIAIPESPVPVNWMDDYVKKKAAALDYSNTIKPFFSISPFSLLAMSLYSYIHDFSSDSLLVSCVYFSFVIPYLIINHSVLNDLISSKRKSLSACHDELALIKIEITEFVPQIQAVAANIETLLVECDHKTISVESRIDDLKALIEKSAKLIRERDFISQEIDILKQEAVTVENELSNKRVFIHNKTEEMRTSLKKEKEAEFVKFILSCYIIHSHEIANVTEKQKTLLVQSGINTAKDVSPSRLSKIKNLRVSTKKAVLNWKKETIRRAKLAIPKKIELEVEDETNLFAERLRDELSALLEHRIDEIQNKLIPTKDQSLSDVEFLLIKLNADKIVQRKLLLMSSYSSDLNALLAKRSILLAALEKCNVLSAEQQSAIVFIDNEIGDPGGSDKEYHLSTRAIFNKYSGLSYSLMPSSFSDKIITTAFVAYCVVYYAAIL